MVWLCLSRVLVCFQICFLSSLVCVVRFLFGLSLCLSVLVFVCLGVTLGLLSAVNSHLPPATNQPAHKQPIHK